MTQTILVVDDDLELRKLVQSYLAEEGFRTATAANGRDALFVALAAGTIGMPGTVAAFGRH